MQITRKLIQQFLEGRCTPEQEYLVNDWLAQHPEQLNRLMTEESWHAFVPTTTSVAASPKMFNYIVQHTKPRVKRWKWMAAASVSLVFSLAALYFINQQKPAVKPIARTQAASRVITTRASADTQQYRLPDGSVATLLPGSTIQYDSAFETARDILLAGEARFSVTKNSNKPFCVHAKNINVTALGTVFSVSDRDLVTSVKLFEGKVVVRQEAHALKKLKEIFLHPGEELNINNKDFSYTLGNIKKNWPSPKKPVIAKIHKAPAKVLRFQNQPLQEVFSELAKLYHIKITFAAGAAGDLRFTGTHNPASETLEELLNTIAMLNNLQVKKKASTFLISPNE